MRFYCSLFVAICLLGSCKPSGTDPCATEFDQLALLSHMGNQIILPRYADLYTKVQEMHTVARAFSNDPTVSSLAEVRAKWQTAFLSWQRAYIFEFGPAETNDLRNQIGNFPAFSDRINDGINSGSFDISEPSYAYARGFVAMDYLLYGIATTDTEIVRAYTDATTAANAKKYLTDVSAAIEKAVGATYTGWRADGGNYIGTFTTTQGLATGNPISLLINQYNAAYELFKNNKLGTPIGAKTSYVAAPTTVEALHSKISLKLMKEAVEASKATFLGTSEKDGTAGIGLDDYLSTVQAEKEGAALEMTIEGQYDLVLSALNGITSSSLQDAISSESEKVKAAYAVAQNMVVFIKTDLPAVLCVNITYVDNTDDGD